MVLPSGLKKKLLKEKFDEPRLEQLREDSSATLEMQKALRGNENLEKTVIDAMLEQGAGLWNGTIDSAVKQYPGKKAVVIHSYGHGGTLHEVKIFDGLREQKGKYYLTGSNLYDLLNNCFVCFCNVHSGSNKTKSSIIATGEGGVLQHASPAWFYDLKGFADNEAGISFISGPFMICENPQRVNEYVKDLAAKKSGGHIKPELRLYRNNILSFTKLFAGYFHFYVVGDNVFAETPHVYMNRSSDEAYRIIVNDADLAERFRNFAEEYTALFAEKMPSDKMSDLNALAEFYATTIDIRTEDINKSKYEKGLRRKITTA